MKNGFRWIAACAALAVLAGCGGTAPDGKKEEGAAAKAIVFGRGAVDQLTTLTDNGGLQETLPADLPLQIAWTLPVPGARILSATVAPPRAKLDAVLLLTEANDLIAIRASNGQALWWLELNGRPLGAPVFTAHAIYLIIDGQVLCIEKHSGEVLWRDALEYPPTPFFDVDESTPGKPLFTFGALNRMIWGAMVKESIWPPERGYGSIRREDVMLQRTTLKTVWRYRTKGLLEGPLTFHSGDVLAADDERRVYCLNAAVISTGEPALRWQSITADANPGGVAIHGSSAFVASRDRSLYCYSVHSGGLIWRNPTGFILMATPQAVKDPGTDAVFVFQQCQEGPLLCLDARTGKVRWQVEGGGRVVTVDDERDNVAAERGSAIIRKTDGSFIAIELNTERVLWTLPALFPVVAENLHDRTFFAIRGGNTLCALRRP